ncbi:MAG: gfo/Idh/MocA family oxidoreductase [Candidatus Neomarinimicrobiota bacterium]|nr:MAG: gfo/Idh/MocA family oxidoreductase [Candidatus Neomarinimicrobiota bacterium]
MSVSKTYRVGLVGCGRIAKVHASVIQQIEGFSLAAVCDIDKSRRKQFSDLYGVPEYERYEDLLEKEKPDLVTIATPNGTHYKIASVCFERGFNVLLEKPITIKNEDAEKLIAVSEKKHVHFFAVKQVRYNPAIQVVKSAIEDGKLGKIFSSSLVVRWTRPQEYFDQSDWRGTRALDGGGLLNQGIHYVDVMQWLMGDVKSIFGKVERFFHRIEIEDAAFGLVHFKSGALGSIEFTINTYPHNLECSLVLLGDKGSVKLGGSAMNKIELWEVKNMPKPVVPEGFPPYVYEGGLYQGSCPNHIFVYQDILKLFRGTKSTVVNGNEALYSLRIVNALYESAEKGKEVILRN